MDIYCGKCGEPWEIDTLHDVSEYLGISFGEISGNFRVAGCAALDATCNPQTVGSTRATVAAAMLDLLGDDIDGVAAMMEDYSYMME